MGTFFFYLAVAACVATAGVLLVGVTGFGTGKITPQTQNRLMRWRIIAQFVAVVLILLTVLALRAD